jgi:hypothetical protein
MAHYAFLDNNNIVTEVIVGKDEGEDGIDWEQWYGSFRGQTCKRTSYNTYAGVHIAGGTPYRKNYAAIGYSYDPARDCFIPPKPYPSWVLDDASCTWKAPVPAPPVEPDKYYEWNETVLNWTEIVPPPEPTPEPEPAP